MHHINRNAKLSDVSEMQTLLRNVLVWYGTLVPLVRTFEQRTNVPYLHKKYVPYLHTAPYCHPCPGTLNSNAIIFQKAFLLTNFFQKYFVA